MSLIAALERTLPDELPVGSSTAVFCVGVCFHPQERIEHLEIVVDGTAYRPAAFGMPRPDVIASEGHGTAERRYHSGFWGTVPITAREAPGAVRLELAARLESGTRESCPLGEIEMVVRDSPFRPVQPDRSAPALIAVCMATFEPDVALFEAQVQSLRAQTNDDWICVISDDCSSPRHFEQIRETIGEDPRFTISRAENRLGFYRNFERALRMVPAEAALVALCDQDDRWHPDKLSTLRDSLSDAVLVYSDLRLVDAQGKVLRDTLWRGRANNHDNLASMLVANTITGAAMLFRRELLEVALPFPDTPGFQFHDHWLAVAALACGEVEYVARPLYDYVQHSGAVFGDVTHGSRSPARPGLRGWLGRLRIPRRSASRRAAYFHGYLSREVQAQVLLARCGARISPRKRRTLRLLVACDSSVGALAWLAARPLRCLIGHTETLGSELELAQGIVWKRLTEARALRSGRRGGPFSDASIPSAQSFSQRRLRRWRSQV